MARQAQSKSANSAKRAAEAGRKAGREAQDGANQGMRESRQLADYGRQAAEQTLEESRRFVEECVRPENMEAMVRCATQVGRGMQEAASGSMRYAQQAFQSIAQMNTSYLRLQREMMQQRNRMMRDNLNAFLHESERVSQAQNKVMQQALHALEPGDREPRQDAGA